MYTAKKSSRKTGKTLLMSLLLIVVIVMCVMTIGARFNNQTVDVNPVAVDEPVATVAPEVIVLPTSAPAATPAPVGAVFPAQASEPVEQFPISVLNGNSGLGPYWVNPQKAELTVEPDQVGHISSLAPYADNGWFVLSQHTVDSIDESQLVEETIYGASLPNVGDANMRSEDHGLQDGALARALYSYVERVDGTAHTLKAEEYDRNIHILVGFIKVGEANNEYWTVWENHQFGYYTLCYVKGVAPVVEQPTWTAPQQPQQPQDPQPTTQPTTPPQDTDWTFQPVVEPQPTQQPIDWGTPDEWADTPANEDDTHYTFVPVDETHDDGTIDWGTPDEWADTPASSEDTHYTFTYVDEYVSDSTGINYGSGWEDSSSSVAADTSYTFTSTNVVVESAPAAVAVVEAAPVVSASAAPAADTNYTFDGGSTSSGSSDIDWGSADEWAD